MYKLLFCCICLVTSTLTLSAQSHKDLAALYPELPASVTDADLRALITAETPSLGRYLPMLSLNNSVLAEKHAPVGKITTKTATIYLTAEIQVAEEGTDYYQLITVSSQSIDNKSGEPVGGGLEFYLTMSGDDALHRQGGIEYDGTTVRFTIKSAKLGTTEVTETETTTYTVGKKYLEFKSRE